MAAMISANLTVMLLSLVAFLAGLYLVMGLCCKGGASRWLGGALGVMGVAGYLFSLLPSCF